MLVRELNIALDIPPECEVNFLEKVAFGEPIQLRVKHLIIAEDGVDVKKILRCPEDLAVVVLQIRVDPKATNLEMVCKTTGILPPGFVHGIYTLTCEQGRYIYTIPANMLNEDEITEEELELWTEMKPGELG